MLMRSNSPPSRLLVKPCRCLFFFPLPSLPVVFFCWTLRCFFLPFFCLVSPVLPWCYCTMMLSDLLISAAAQAPFFAWAAFFLSKLGSGGSSCVCVSFHYAPYSNRKPTNFLNLSNIVHIMFPSLIHLPYPCSMVFSKKKCCPVSLHPRTQRCMLCISKFGLLKVHWAMHLHFFHFP